jgi:hypothetical protein
MTTHGPGGRCSGHLRRVEKGPRGTSRDWTRANQGLTGKVSGFPTVLVPAYSLLKQEQLQLAAQASCRDMCSLCMYVCMDGWMDACMYVCMCVYLCVDGWMDGCVDGWTDGCTYVCMHACMHVRMYDWRFLALALPMLASLSQKTSYMNGLCKICAYIRSCLQLYTHICMYM